MSVIIDFIGAHPMLSVFGIWLGIGFYSVARVIREMLR